MKKFSVFENCNLKSFTDGTFPQGSFYFSKLIKNRDIKVNGVRVGGNVPLKAGDEVIYYTTPAEESRESHKVVYEDENILIIDKFQGVTSEGLFFELGDGFVPLHRLDRNTAGLLAFGKGKAADELLDAFKNGKVKKVYYAICKNNFKESSGTLKNYLKKLSDLSEVLVSDKPREGYLTAITDYEVIEYLGDVARVKFTLHTGRTHQIRAQTAHAGFPVLGDNKYGDYELNKKYKLVRQVLVSKELTFFVDGHLLYLNGKVFKSAFEAVINN